MSERLARIGDRDWRVLDTALAIALLLAAWLQVATSDVIEGPLLANLALAGAAALALSWRRIRPVAVAAWIAACTIAMQVALTSPPRIPAVSFLLIVASYSVGAHAGRRGIWAGLAITTGCLLAVSVLDNPSDVAFPVIVFGIVPWVVGRTLRGHTALARELAEKAELTEHLRAEEARHAVAAERARVARELHDVLAHNLSVMVIQASAAQRVLDDAPDKALDAAQLIARTGRDTLAELRRLFGAVHHDEGEGLDGSPGLAHLDQLVQRARHAGLSVSLQIEGEPRGLGRGADLAAYRVVQEALTNTLKHAGQVRAAVTVRYEPADVTLEVVDNGSRGPRGKALLDGAGHGLLGMRERCAMYGGELDAGERAEGGFRVLAKLPLERSEARA